MNIESKYIFFLKITTWYCRKYEFKFITTMQTINIKNFHHIVEAFDQHVQYM